MISSKPRKKRKELYTAPLHLRRKLMSATLKKELRKEFGRRSLPVRTGDKVKVMRGSYAGLTGKVREVDLKNYKVYIEEITREKVDGTKVHVPIHPSNLMIIDPDMSDRMRQKIIERSGGKVREELKEKEEVKEEKKEKEEGITCPVCKKTFGTKDEMQAHLTKEHKDYTR